MPLQLHPSSQEFDPQWKVLHDGATVSKVTHGLITAERFQPTGRPLSPWTNLAVIWATTASLAELSGLSYNSLWQGPATLRETATARPAQPW